ncbi:PPOX class probable F420-dependent enzyme [Nocardia tenerifensis]|uniref:PPOX class probable F420-dependent enzyme n=1 Tax=Nocardia tenerifensis TaxID=228006 RepID=A0A318JYG7_9NOCA|nr:PPOX class F420-dependent oxidoreductase [Nocardia tenerifensis]PXX60328.1 PPOX class probable F420-dependent enzyme [Nocardia tenerifensis]
MNHPLIPDSHADLLTRPLYGHLATLTASGDPQVTPMWYLWDGEVLRFTTTTDRRKYHNIQKHPRVAISIHDPDQPYRYLEVRGEVGPAEPDPTGDFFDVLARRYDLTYNPPVADHPRRVVLVLRPSRVSYQ